MWSRAALIVLTGCGRLGFGAAGDAATDAPREDADAVPLGPWSTPVPVNELVATGAIDDDPTLTADMLEIYFNSDRAGGLGVGDIWMALRATTTDPFGAPVNVAELNSASAETTPEISADGLTMYLASERSSGNFDIFVSTRASRASAWTTPMRVPELISPAPDESPTMSSDGLTLYFDSTRLTTNVDKVFRSTRPTTSSTWSAPEVIPELDGLSEEENPFPETSGVAIWATVGGTLGDLYVATRATPAASWGPWVIVAELSSPALDLDPWVSPDGRTIFMTSTRSGAYLIYMSTR